MQARASCILKDMGLKVTAAKREDIPELVTILTKATEFKLAHDDKAWGSQPYTEKEVGLSLEAGTTYTARRDGEIVGTVMLLWEDEGMWSKQPPDAGYIHRLAIKEGLHGQGLGSQIMDWAAKEVAKKGRKYLRLDCPSTNIELCAYYETNGFTRVATKPNPMYPNYTAAYFERTAK